MIDEKVIQGLLKSSVLGEERLQTFINDRLLPSDERVSFFSPIKNPNLDTGLKKPKLTPKVITVLKEDKQAFGLLVGKSTSLQEAHSYPLTSVPLALASPDGDLRQGSKASLRNYLIEEFSAISAVASEGAKWIVDGMAIMRGMKPRETWGEFCESFIKACMPDKDSAPATLVIIM